MIIVDNALRARAEQGRPIRVGLLGAGFMGQGLTNQIVNSVPGMRLSAIYGRKIERARHLYAYAGCETPILATSQAQLDEAVRRDRPVVTEDPMLLARAEPLDVLVDVTGSVEFGAHVFMEAFRHAKDVVLMNAELDATIGPIMQVHARRAGVIMSACDGDEPGVQMNLVRWVR